MSYPHSTGSMADNASSFVHPFAISAISIPFLNKLRDFKMFDVSSVQCIYFFCMNGLYGDGLIYMQTLGSLCILYSFTNLQLTTRL